MFPLLAEFGAFKELPVRFINLTWHGWCTSSPHRLSNFFFTVAIWLVLFILNQVDGCAGVHPSCHWKRAINLFVVNGRKLEEPGETHVLTMKRLKHWWTGVIYNASVQHSQTVWFQRVKILSRSRTCMSGWASHGLESPGLHQGCRGWVDS